MVRILTRRSRAKIPMARLKKSRLACKSTARERRERAPKARGSLAKRARASVVSRVTKIRKNRKRTLRKSMKKVRLSIYCTQIRPKSRRYFFSYRDQSDVQVIWRVNHENSASIHLSNSSSVIFIIPLFGVSFSESRKSKLREKFGKSGSILKQKTFSAVRTRERPPV